MSTRTRNILLMVGILVVAVIFSFVILPAGGTGVAIPVVEVAGETVVEDWLPGFNLTNTIIGTVVTDILVLLIAFILWRMTKGWTRKVPSRLQGLFEVLIDGFRGFSRGIAGERLKAPMLWPLVVTIFFFLLVANYMKLFPGVETVGKLHCAYAETNGFPMIEGASTPFGNSYRLWVDQAIYTGQTQTTETEEACKQYFDEGAIPDEGFPQETPASIEESAAVFTTLLDGLPEEEAERESAYESNLESLSSEQLGLIGEDTDYEYAESYVEFANTRMEAAENLEVEQALLGDVEALLEELEADEPSGLSELASSITDGLEGVETEAAADVRTQFEEVEVASATADDHPELVSALETLRDEQTEAVNLARTRISYPEATVALSGDAFEENENGEVTLTSSIVPYLFHVTPFVRGPATDLSFTFGLALIAIVAVQLYGIRALGLSYFEKFINISAMRKIHKSPMNLIQVIVGLLEIVSEIAKFVSLSFRLFGNLFAGGIALMVVTFLVAFLVPGVIYGLEVIIGGVQALIFAVLTLVFSVLAMEPHHDDEHHDDHGAETAQ